MNKEKGTIFIIFSIAVLLRLTFWSAYIKDSPKRAFYTIDSYTYEFPAITLMEKGRYINDCPRPIPQDFPQKCIPAREPEIARPPGYPLFIIIHYLIAGEKPRWVVFTQNIIDASKVFIINAIAKAIGLRGFLLYLPSILHAISPSSIVFSQAIMTETLQSFFILILIFILIRTKSIYGAIATGFLAGILCWIHPIWWFFSISLPIFLFLFLIREKKLKKTLILSFSAGLSFWITISPWLIRNYIIWRIFIYRGGGEVFLNEIYVKMEKGEWSLTFKPDVKVYNEASERFGWNVRFQKEEDIKNYPFTLTQREQVASVLREKILKNIFRYPISVHFVGFMRSLPPFGIAHLHYIITGNINPSREEITRFIIPELMRGKLKNVWKEIKEKRLWLLPPVFWVFYTIGWMIRLLSCVFMLFPIFTWRKEILIMFFVIIYATFIMMTLDAGQPRRFYTVEAISFILVSVGISMLIPKRRLPKYIHKPINI